ncbi:MAG: cytochrome c [Pelagibacteraceae bacterium]
MDGWITVLILKYRNLAILYIFLITITSSASADEVITKGKAIFNEKAGCGACHVLKHAGSVGNVGPSLDSSKDSKNVAYVKDMVQNGLGVMPAFGEDGILTPQEVDIVSKYVAKVAGK